MDKKQKNNIAGRSTKFVSVAAKETPFAYVEAYKSLRTNIGFLSNVSGVRSILITSAIPMESKSTTAINLAITLADSGHSVVLVECDLRKPVLRKYLKRELGQTGLAAYLAGLVTLDDCIVDLTDLGISVIGAGVVPPNPSELLNTTRMQELVELLKHNYDYVILDAPPVTVVTDAAVVGRLTDGALLVVRSKFASARTVRQAKAKLENVGIRILGGVLTRFNMRKSGWRAGYDYNQYEYGYVQKRMNR
jgi:capsular exopolysaccharide synthesis family protein